MTRPDVAAGRTPGRTGDETGPLATAVSVRLVSTVMADREAILAFVPPNGCPGRLSSRPAATWGTLSARLLPDDYHERVLDRWREDKTVLMLRAGGHRKLHLASGDDELWLLVDGD